MVGYQKCFDFKIINKETDVSRTIGIAILSWKVVGAKKFYLLYAQNSLKPAFRHFRGMVSGSKCQHHIIDLCTKIKKYSQFFHRWTIKLRKRAKSAILKVGFMAKIEKEITWNQNSVISYGPLNVSCYQNFQIKSNLRKWKKTPAFQVKI